jgi:beta-fructofuranosidase
MGKNIIISKYVLTVISITISCVAHAGTATAVENSAHAAKEESANKKPRCSRFRFVPGRRGFGDPMPFYWNGEYHVFYLTNPAGNYDVNWEHIVSTDLVNWKELPAALSVDKNDPTGPDGGCIFTGDVIEKDGVFHAWYTNWNPLNPKGREFISHATSRDLINWTKHPEHMIAPDGIHYANHPTRDFRDPEIFWNPESREYWMILFANVPNQWWGRFALLTSDDLINWKQEMPIEGVPGDETPSYLRFGNTHYIIGNDFGYSSAKSARGPYIRPKFWNSIPVRELDTAGQAAKTTWDGKRYLWFGGWSGGSMPIPREVYEGPEGLLYMKPAEEIVAFFNKTAIDLTEQPSRTSLAVPPAYMLDYRIKMYPQSRITISFGGKYHLGLIPSQATLSVNGPGIDLGRPYGRPCPVDTSQSVKIQVFVDDTLIECFINDQFAQTCIVDKWWPMESTLMFSVEGGKVDVHKCMLRVHE